MLEVETNVGNKRSTTAAGQMTDGDMLRPSPEKIAGNATLTVVARLSMIAVAAMWSLTLFFGRSWLDGRFENQKEATSRVEQQVQDLPSLRSRIVVLETNQARGRADRQDFQKQMIARMDRMQDAIIGLSNTVAGLTATIKAQQDRDYGKIR